jgi:cellulose synthase/poly-beta-1,6-N-acetylglucosamine synthase-like glycosyltransferase
VKYAFVNATECGIFEPMMLFFCFIGVCYLLLMLNYWRGWLATPISRAVETTNLSVTVIVVARNEERNIDACLQSLFAQKIPTGCSFEVILVDDHSTDQTASIAQNCGKAKAFKLLHLTDYTGLLSKDVAFKKRAIEYALSKTNSEIIITTDADCVVQPLWLAYMLAPFVQEKVQIAGGSVLFHNYSGFLGHFQALDFCGTMGLTAAGIRQGWQRMANGANLAFRRSAYEAVGGYTSNTHRASGDDMFLMQAIAEKHPESVVFVKHPEAVVYTVSEPDLRSFVAQRLRWGTKSSGYGEWRTQLALVVAYLMCLSICVTFLVGLLAFSGSWLGWALLLLVVKAVADFPLLASTSRFFGVARLISWFWPSLALHALYVTGVGTASLLVRRYVWKGRMVE